MDTERQQELISAYLDGEVTADEKRAAEALLAESEEVRQLLEELRGLRSRVRELPKFSLGADFSQAVLDQAERAMISGAGVGGASDPDENDADAASDDHDLHVFYSEQDKVDRAAAMKRRIVWSVLAVAAALLIMVVLPPKPEPENIARRDNQAGDQASKATAELAEADKVPAGKAGADKADRKLSVSAANEATDMAHDDISVAATEQKSEQEGAVRRGFSQAPSLAAKSLAQDGASADSPDQSVAGAIGGGDIDTVDRAAVAESGGVGAALGVASESEELQIAAAYDGIAVFEIDEKSDVSVDGLKLPRDADAPANGALSIFRRVPLDKLADLRAAPVADEAETDVAKANGDSAEHIYVYVAEGTSEQIKSAFDELKRGRAAHYQPVEMKPQLALMLGDFGGGGRSLDGVDPSVVGNAKKQPARPDAFAATAEAESPAANAIVPSPSKPAPALAEKPAAPKKPDNADARDKLRKANDASEPGANRDATKSPSAPQPFANASAPEKNGRPEMKFQEPTEELVKRVVRSIRKAELRTRQQSQRELAEPLSEAAAVADHENTKDIEKQGAKEVAKETTTDKQARPNALSQTVPAPVAEPADELPVVQRAKEKATGAGQTYRVLVVLTVKPKK